MPNNAMRKATCFLIDRPSGVIEEVSIISDQVLDITRKIKPSHGSNFTGRFPIRYEQEGRTESIPYESGLERKFLEWIQNTGAVKKVSAQPFKVTGYIRGIRREYTPDFRIDLFVVPHDLVGRGFGATTIVEVKPASQAFDRDVLLKLCLLRLATDLPVALITEQTMSMPLQRLEANHVH